MKKIYSRLDKYQIYITDYIILECVIVFGVEKVLLKSPSQQFTGDVEKYSLFTLLWFPHHPARC